MGEGRAPNAQTHGAQSRPEPAETRRHLTRILGREPTGLDLGELGPRELAALRLADCEARLDRAHAHYAEVQGRDREPGLDEAVDHLEDLLLFDWVADGAKWEAARRIMRLDHFSRHYAGRRKRLASRYLREAQSRRDKALEEFLKYELPK